MIVTICTCSILRCSPKHRHLGEYHFHLQQVCLWSNYVGKQCEVDDLLWGILWCVRLVVDRILFTYRIYLCISQTCA